MPIRKMKESSEQHIVIKTHNTQMQNSMNPLQNSHNTAQNSKDPPQESRNTELQQHRPSPGKNRSRRKGRGGTKSVLSDVSMHPSSGVCHFNGPVSTRIPTGSVDNGGHACDVEMGVPSSSKSLRFPLRPGYGQAGVKCIVKANHFLTELPDKDLNHYDVTITPELVSKSVNRAIMAELVKQYRESDLGMRLPAYDGRKSLYTAGELPFTSKEFKVKLVDDDDDGFSGPK